MGTNTTDGDLTSARSVLAHTARQSIPTLAHVCMRCDRTAASYTTAGGERLCWRCYEQRQRDARGETDDDEAERESADLSAAADEIAASIDARTASYTTAGGERLCWRCYEQRQRDARGETDDDEAERESADLSAAADEIAASIDARTSGTVRIDGGAK